MNEYMSSIILFTIAFMVSLVVYPLVLRFAVRHDIVDNPDARKLQRHPVPVMGGVVVYIGILVAVLVGYFVFEVKESMCVIVCMSVMLVLGTTDDIRGLGVGIRFLIELIAVTAIVLFTGYSIDDFHGFLGIHHISPFVSWPLSIVAGVGIINATNLIDGVDGYSSGYGVMSCSLFAVLFFLTGHTNEAMFALIVAAAIIPFFMHNVFGKKSKMFIGDGGTLMLGMALTSFLFYSLSSNGACVNFGGVNPVALSIAILAVPVFDTVRVMGGRISKGRSPFHPDKTHLHHLFIDLGFSHVGTAVAILTINFTVVVLCWLGWSIGLNDSWQIIISVVLGFLITFGIYNSVRRFESHDSKMYVFLCNVGRATHIERQGVWLALSLIIDGEWRKGNVVKEVKRQVKKYDVETYKAELNRTLVPKERDVCLIKAYLEGKTNVSVDDIIKFSGADNLRVYPIIYQMVLDENVVVIKQNDLGQIKRVQLK